MTAKRSDEMAKTPKAEELKDADLEKAAGGLLNDDNWVKGGTRPTAKTGIKVPTKPLESETDDE